MRSVRLAEPVLIWQVPSATARSAIVVSSVSPLRRLMTDVYPLRCANSTAEIVSDNDPIWLTLTRMLLATPSSIPCCKRLTFVTNRSSPTSCTFSPSARVSFFHPFQSSSEQPSSIEQIGYLAAQPSSSFTISSLPSDLPSNLYVPAASSWNSVEATSSAILICEPGL